ncbi:hypothetical protein BGZ70_003442 [Mortierella alpina]|uniref:HTH CENPB-type domain-containing protein n=1 Tax=Mortierella alpina TaxID=64518 RepID=A0A9P6JB12_MORAP|nr:hypothetical protein BGZ70_003442 [Mortierella alpina]
MTQPTINMQQQQQQQQQLDDPESELLLLKLEREHRQQQQQQLEQQQQQQQQHQQQQSQQQQPQQQQQQQDPNQEQGHEDEPQQDEDTQPNAPPVRVGGSTGRNVALTNANRRDICLQRAAHPAMTLEALAIWAQLEFNLARKPAMGTLSRILSKQSRYSSMSAIELQGQRKRNVLCSELDDALLMWVRENQDRNIHVSYKMIIQKAKELGAYIKTLPGRENTEVPAFSNGWVSGFTKRHHLIGTALNAPGASSLAAINEMIAGGFAPAILPLSTDEQLIARSLAAKAAREAAEQQMQQENFMEHHDHDHRMDGAEVGNEDTVMEEIEEDLQHQMVHAVGMDSQPSSSSTPSSTSDPIDTPVDGPTAPIVSSMAPPLAKSKRGRKKSTGVGLPSREQLRQQAHPAAPGMVSAARSRGSSPPLTPTSSALLAQQLQHLQQQAQLSQQASSPTATSNGSLEVAAAAAAAVTATGVTSKTATTAKAIGSTSTTSTGTAGGTSSGTSPAARPIPTKAEALAAVQTVINSLNVHIPAEVDLLRPLFDMERRLQNELHAGERQSTTAMIWSK